MLYSPFTKYCSGEGTLFNKQRKGPPSLKEQGTARSIHLPVRPSQELLASKIVSQIVKNLPLLLDIPSAEYNRFYVPALVNFVEFVQELPVYKSTTYNYLGGARDLGIARAYVVTEHYLKNKLSKGSLSQHAEKTPLWTYALFTAGLFYQLGYIYTNLCVMLCNEKKYAIQRWNPFEGPMSPVGYYYRYCFDSVNRDLHAARVTPLLAEKLMGKNFKWIFDDKDVSEYWIAILQNDERAGGLFAKNVMMAEDQLVQNPAFLEKLGITLPESYLQSPSSENFQFSTLLDKPNKEGTQTAKATDTLSGRPLSMSEAGNQTQDAEAFLKWLIEGIKIGALGVNRPDSLVHIVHASVLVRYPEIFRLFKLENPHIKSSVQEMHKSLQEMGVLLNMQDKARQYTTTAAVTHTFTLGGGATKTAPSQSFSGVWIDPTAVYVREAMPLPNPEFAKLSGIPSHQFPTTDATPGVQPTSNKNF